MNLYIRLAGKFIRASARAVIVKKKKIKKTKTRLCYIYIYIYTRESNNNRIFAGFPSHPRENLPSAEDEFNLRYKLWVCRNKVDTFFSLSLIQGKLAQPPTSNWISYRGACDSRGRRAAGSFWINRREREFSRALLRSHGKQSHYSAEKSARVYIYVLFFFFVILVVPISTRQRNSGKKG